MNTTFLRLPVADAVCTVWTTTRRGRMWFTVLMSGVDDTHDDRDDSTNCPVCVASQTASGK